MIVIGNSGHFECSVYPIQPIQSEGGWGVRFVLWEVRISEDACSEGSSSHSVSIHQSNDYPEPLLSETEITKFHSCLFQD